jgi:hypothetical protein
MEAGMSSENDDKAASNVEGAKEAATRIGDRDAGLVCCDSRMGLF